MKRRIAAAILSAGLVAGTVAASADSGNEDVDQACKRVGQSMIC